MASPGETAVADTEVPLLVAHGQPHERDGLSARLSMALAGLGNTGGRVVVAGGVKFGVYVPTHGPYGDPALLRDLAVAAEAAGWDGFFVWDSHRL